MPGVPSLATEPGWGGGWAPTAAGCASAVVAAVWALGLGGCEAVAGLMAGWVR